MDAHVIRLLYVAIAILMLLTVGMTRMPRGGLALMAGLTVLHTVMAILLGVRLAGDVAGDRHTGVVGLLALSGVPSQHVVQARLATSLISFASVWIVRYPMLLLALSLGQLHLRQILLVESLHLALFLFVLGMGLVYAHRSRDRMEARAGYLFAGLLEFLLYLPGITLTILRNYTSWTLPNGIVETADILRQGCITRSLYHALFFPHSQTSVLVPAVLYTLLGIGAFAWWNRQYFQTPDEADDLLPSSEARPKSSRKVRASRRCWDDALAWQAVHFYSGGLTNTIVRLIIEGGVILTAIALTVSGRPDLSGFALVMLIVCSLILLFMGQGKVSDCLQKELRDKTLSSLLMTPHTPLELCDGWGRGAWKMMWVDMPVHAATIVAMFLYSPSRGAPMIVCGMIMVLASRHFLTLSPLVPYSILGVLTGVGLIFVPILFVGWIVGLSIRFQPWIGPIALIPLAVGWSALCRKMIPSWFAKKQESLE